MDLLTTLPLLNDLLETWRPSLGQDYPAYHNHCYRVVNHAVALTAGNPEPAELERFCVAAAFHDLGIWTHHTFDYLQPSADMASDWLVQHGHDDWLTTVQGMILEHHKMTTVSRDATGGIEAFRKADWVDVTLGMRRFGLSRAWIRQVQLAFPDAGFHRKLMQLALQRVRQHPLSPLPMFKF